MPSAKSALSEYELQRQANIAERDALLKSLNLEAASSNALAKPKSGATTKNGPAKKKSAAAAAGSKRASRAQAQPTRTSSRLKGIEADSEKHKKRVKEEEQAQAEQERVKRMRVSGPLALGDIVVDGIGDGSGPGFLVDIANRGARPYERTFGDEDVKQTTDKELRALREKMSGLSLWSKVDVGRCKVVPERIYTMAIHPAQEKVLIWAGDKLGNLGVLNVDDSDNGLQQEATIKDEAEESNGIKQENEKTKSSIRQDKAENDEDDEDDEAEFQPNITSFKVHTRTISSIHVNPSTPTSLLTSSYDSSLRSLDLASLSSSEVYGPADTSSDSPLTGIDSSPLEPSLIYFSFLDGLLGRLDIRAKPESAELWRCSEKKIGGFSLAPQTPHYFATASLDRSMRVWDIRKLVKCDFESGSPSGKMPSVVGVHYSRLSVSHAAFSRSGHVVTSSYDDTIKVYDLAGKGLNTWSVQDGIAALGGEPDGESSSDWEEDVRIRHNNQTGRWVTILRGVWQQSPSSWSHIPRFSIGNMNRFVDIYSANGDQLAQLSGEGITAVPAVTAWHPSRDIIAGGTASGKVAVWL